MVRIITTLFLFLLFITSSIFAQSTSTNLTGDWYGQLDIQGTKLKINFHVTEKDGSYTTTMDSPDQGAMGIPTTKTVINNNTIEVIIENMNVNFSGILKETKIEGVFKQNGMELPLQLTRDKIVSEAQLPRPQDPIEPYSYKSEDIFFSNKAVRIKLAGTLTIPNGVQKPPVAILISGSGPQNRNEEIKAFNHRPFLVLSDYLTTNGIAVLRYDDRGVAQSEGVHKGATSADFATDVEAAVAYLKTRNDIDVNKIGLIGHSEGGFIAPMVASRDKDIAFIVFLAGTGVDGATILQTQERRANELNGIAKEVLNYNEILARKLHEIVKLGTNKNEIKTNLTEYLTNFRKNDSTIFTKSITDQMTNQMVNSLCDEWLTYFIQTDPDQFLSKVTCPVLALNGEKDFQVLPKLNLNGIENSLKKAKNKDVTIVELEGLNHLFQTCETGSLQEYGKLEETFSPKALKIIGDWILKRFHSK